MRHPSFIEANKKIIEFGEIMEAQGEGPVGLKFPARNPRVYIIRPRGGVSNESTMHTSQQPVGLPVPIVLDQLLPGGQQPRCAPATICECCPGTPYSCDGR